MPELNAPEGDKSPTACLARARWKQSEVRVNPMGRVKVGVKPPKTFTTSTHHLPPSSLFHLRGVVATMIVNCWRLRGAGVVTVIVSNGYDYFCLFYAKFKFKQRGTREEQWAVKSILSNSSAL